MIIINVVVLYSCNCNEIVYSAYTVEPPNNGHSCMGQVQVSL